MSGTPIGKKLGLIQTAVNRRFQRGETSAISSSKADISALLVHMPAF
jgi:hypothetical protein